jgi:hypothetical protein
VNSVSGDNDGGIYRFGVTANVSAFKMGGGAAFVVVDSGEVASGNDSVGTKSLDRGVVKHHLESAAMK